MPGAIWMRSCLWRTEHLTLEGRGVSALGEGSQDGNEISCARASHKGKYRLRNGEALLMRAYSQCLLWKRIIAYRASDHYNIIPKTAGPTAPEAGITQDIISLAITPPGGAGFLCARGLFDHCAAAAHHNHPRAPRGHCCVCQTERFI